MILTENDYYEYGNTFGLNQEVTQKTNPEFVHCNHSKSKT